MSDAAQTTDPEVAGLVEERADWRSRTLQHGYEELTRRIESLLSRRVAEAVEAEREANCKAMCALCRGLARYETEAHPATYNATEYRHAWKPEYGHGSGHCTASPIRQRTPTEGDNG